MLGSPSACDWSVHRPELVLVLTDEIHLFVSSMVLVDHWWWQDGMMELDTTKLRSSKLVWTRHARRQSSRFLGSHL